MVLYFSVTLKTQWKNYNYKLIQKVEKLFWEKEVPF